MIKEENTVYGYARISTKKQKIERQIHNIKAAYPNAIIVEEIYTGTKFQGRDKLESLIKKVKSGDTIVFDEVSRMSRNATEGYELYKELYERGITLVFIKEPQINTETYSNAMSSYIQRTNTPADILLEAVEKFILALAEEQIKLAFSRSEQEVMFLRQRTKDGLTIAKLNGKHIGRKLGNKVETEKMKKAIPIIIKNCEQFNGSNTVQETCTLAGISIAQYYRYKRYLLNQEANNNEA